MAMIEQEGRLSIRRLTESGENLSQLALQMSFSSRRYSWVAELRAAMELPEKREEALDFVGLLFAFSFEGGSRI